MARKKPTKSQAKRAVKRHPKLIAAIVIIVVLIIIAAVVLYVVKPELYHKYIGIGKHSFTEWEVVKENDCGNDGLKKRSCTVCGEEESEVLPATENHTYGDDNICTVCGYDNNTPTVAGVSAADFSIHFMELGNKSAGDGILIKCGTTEVLIDAGSEQSSATTIKSYLDDYCTDGVLEYVISTHADSDHISAFVGTQSDNGKTGILYNYEIGTFIKFDKSDKALETKGGNKTLYAQYLDAVAYIGGKGTNVYTASQCYDEEDGAKRQYYLDESHTVSINVLYNYYYYNSSADENNYSVVTLLTQELEGGNKHYLFTGDLEEDGESKMVDYYSDSANSKSVYDILPEVEVYKAGHHGSKTSSTEKLLAVIKPKYVAVCCCCGAPEYTTINDNTFPTQEMIDNVSKYTDKIYVTTLGTGLPEKDENGDYVSRSYDGYESMNGNIVFYAKGTSLKLWCSNNYTLLKDTAWFKENRTWQGN